MDLTPEGELRYLAAKGAVLTRPELIDVLNISDSTLGSHIKEGKMSESKPDRVNLTPKESLCSKGSSVWVPKMEVFQAQAL